MLDNWAGTKLTYMSFIGPDIQTYCTTSHMSENTTQLLYSQSSPWTLSVFWWQVLRLPSLWRKCMEEEVDTSVHTLPQLRQVFQEAPSSNRTLSSWFTYNPATHCTPQIQYVYFVSLNNNLYVSKLAARLHNVSTYHLVTAEVLPPTFVGNHY